MNSVCADGEDYISLLSGNLISVAVLLFPRLNPGVKEGQVYCPSLFAEMLTLCPLLKCKQPSLKKTHTHTQRMRQLCLLWLRISYVILKINLSKI